MPWRLWALLGVLLFAACSSNDEKDQESKVADLVDFDSVVKHKKLWSRSTGEGKGRRYLRLVPAIVGDTIYAANAKGDVYALRMENGKRLWASDVERRISGGVGASATEVVLGSLNGEVIALAADSGEQLWSAKVSGEVLGAPATDGEVVVAQTIDARVFAFDAKTGAQLWRYDHVSPVLTLRGSAGPVLTSSGVIVAFDNGQMLSFAKSDGVLQWDLRVSQPKGKTDLERIVDVDGTPVVDGGMVYAASYQGNLVALNRAQGKGIWRKALSSHQRLAVASAQVFASTDRSRVVSFNAVNGDQIWQNEALLNRGIGAPAAVGDYVAVIDEDDYLHLLDSRDGSFAHRFKPAGDGFHAPMLSHQGKLYILSDDGVLSAYQFVPR